MYEVCFDLCSRLVLDHDEAMFLSIGPHQDAEPRLLCEPDEQINKLVEMQQRKVEKY